MKTRRSCWKTILGTLIVTLALSLGGCPQGGAPNGPTQPGDSSQPTVQVPPAPGEACASPQAMFDAMTPTTYAVVAQLQFSADPPVVDDLFIATAFAVEPTLLATNAHVTETLTETIWPVPVERVVAVQAGTGVVVEITGAVAHPQYTGDPLGSPDVGLLRLAEPVDECLVVPAANEELPAANGDTLALTGFPGDVQDWFTIEVGQTVPQATALTGAVTALRNFSPDVTVSAENVDVLQHQVS